MSTYSFLSSLSSHHNQPVFFLSYLINPKICHRLVGHIEEEAVKTVSWEGEGWLRRIDWVGEE